jgi:hypothetical protein
MINYRFINQFIVILFPIVTIILSCKAKSFRNNYNNLNQLLHDENSLKHRHFLKAHLKNGDICVFNENWKIDSIQSSIYGKGNYFDFNRKKIKEGDLTIPIDSVVIYETNKNLKNKELGRITALSILTGLNTYFGFYCYNNPKACFGSCPTFYLNENDDFHYADAEGFSNAISPSLEYFDIDALNNHFFIDSSFSIKMKNEALETHCIKDIKLYAYPLSYIERVYHTSNDNFYLCENNYEIKNATGEEGDITSLLNQNDRIERFSLADDKNLSSKEEVFFSFENINDSKNLGLIINFRQSLMTTFFIYNGISYMGNNVSDFFAKIETNKYLKSKLDAGLKKELGNIDLYFWNEETLNWEFINGVYETGPIAINRQLIPINKNIQQKNIQFKLVMNKGLWRIDLLSLTNIKNEINPIELLPVSVKNKEENDPEALNQIVSQSEYLISMPGSEYKIFFDLPIKNSNYELFLYSKGYYIEWMRTEWLKDKNLLKLKQMIDNPKKYLKVETKPYKNFEEKMEEIFWNSKINTKSFSYYED